MAASRNNHPIAWGRRPGKEEYEQRYETELFSRSNCADELGGHSSYASYKERKLKGTLPSRTSLEDQVNEELMSPTIGSRQLYGNSHTLSANAAPFVPARETANYCSNRNYSSEFGGRPAFGKPYFSQNDRRQRHGTVDSYGGAYYRGRSSSEYHPYGRYENTQIYRNESWTQGTNQNWRYARNQNYYYGREVSNRGFVPMSRAHDDPYARNEYGSYQRSVTNRYLSGQSSYENYSQARRLIGQYGTECTSSYGMNMEAQGIRAGQIRHDIHYDDYVAYRMDISTHPYVDQTSFVPYQSFQAREARNHNLQHYTREPRKRDRHTFEPTPRCLDLKIDNKTNESDKPHDEVLVEQIRVSNGGIERQLTHPSGRRKLLVLDLNGLLADVTSDGNLIRKPDTRIRRKAVFRRPFCDDFLKFCFEKFDVGIWSSRLSKNVESLVDFLMGDAKDRLLFCWDQSHCTSTGLKTIDNAAKPLVLKELKKLWDKDVPDLPWSKGYYSPSNTLLVDDSPYKALCNPPHTAIFPNSYHYTDDDDCSLGPGGDIQVYLEGLAMCDNVQDYVRNHPFGQRAITCEDPNWSFYKNIIDKFEQSAVEPVMS